MTPHLRTVALLSAAQALLLTSGVMLISVTGLVGLALAPDPRLATLPVTAYVLGAALATLPASQLMQRHGRRRGFLIGPLFGIGGAMLAALANLSQTFWLLCAGMLSFGVYNAFGQYYRFAAADVAPETHKSRAISLTLGGGIAGGFLGPWLGELTRELGGPRFTGSYLALALVGLASMGIASRLSLPHTPPAAQAGSGRPMHVIARQPKFLVAVLAAALGYGVMNLLMSATPIAMELCGFGFSDAALVLQWHVIGMFAPSFVTGSLIRRIGILPVIVLGAVLVLSCVGLALDGITLDHFFWALLLLGVGWNFLYIGGTTLLTESYEPSEKAKVQGCNDLLVFAAMLTSSLGSGVVITSSGWPVLNRIALVPVLLTILASLVLLPKLRRSAPAR